MSDNIKVVVKVRPLILRESENELSYQWRVKNNTLYQLDHNGREFGPCFTFDKVYDIDTRTSDIYNDIAKPIVEASTAGFNGTIFAYGQTSSGKTYTMTGTEQSPGIIPLAVYNLFDNIKNIPDRDFLVRVSYIEIYNETLRDLLNMEKKIKVHENHQGVKVDCTEEVTTSPDEVLKYLKQGEANRQTGATNMNEESSRSHSIFQITIESREHIEGEEQVGCVNVSTLNLVDLAGSERAGQTGSTGLRFKEGTHINKSLSTLALVIKQLSEDQSRYVNYRDSKLTRILQNSLGGNAKTSIICAVTPAAVEETISTLQFANRAKAIKNKPEVNAVATDATMIQSLTKQLSKLQSQLEKKKNLEVMLESKKNVEQHNYDLQKRIASLQRLILNGFVQRSSLDMAGGARRKLVQPRRVTISTLHPIAEDPVSVALPKFHTPLLKYNPMSISNNTDFVPIQNTNKLSSVSEENDNRLITPPPLLQDEKKANFNDEVIELDSDDDNDSPEILSCSPYHKCYGSTVTPPCVLRKNAKLAEKNLKEFVEFTELEKLHPPDMVELIKKIEETASEKTRLQDEMNLLHKTCKERDLEIDHLKVKVTKSVEEIESVNSAKTALETLCKEYTTKLTDWEVSYETLKKKTKLREEELLSLLEEQRRPKKIEDCSKPVTQSIEKEFNFMDMSKDVSLINSDNESSIFNANDCESSSNFQDLVTDLQNQLTLKNEIILKLETDTVVQKQRIESLERSCQNLQNIIDDFKDKMSLFENENSLYKSTIDTLNCTIQSQKTNLESAHADIESYNVLIQELQIKLANKAKTLDINIDETSLETMIANEEKFIANNENMKNIITTLKLAIDSRNKEIETLKSAGHNSFDINNDLKEQLTFKDIEINTLNDKTKSLQDQINDNITTIDKLMQEKSRLIDVEHDLTMKLTNLAENNSKCEKIIEKNELDIIASKESTTKLMDIIAEKNTRELELFKVNEDLKKEIQELDAKVCDLEKDISTKDGDIVSLKNKDILLQKYISNAKLSLQIFVNILTKLTGECYDKNDSDEDIFSVLNDKFLILEVKVSDMISQKDLDLKNSLMLIKELESSNEKLSTELKLLQSNTDLLSKSEQDLDQYKNALQQIKSEHNEIYNQFELNKVELETLRTNLSNTEEQNKNLHSDFLVQANMISALKDKESSLLSQIQTLTLEMNTLNNTNIQKSDDFKAEVETKNKLVAEKDLIIDELRENLKRLDNDLEEKVEQVDNLNIKIKKIIETENLHLNSISNEVNKIFDLLSINNFIVNSTTSIYETIHTSLNKIAVYVVSMKDDITEESSKLSKMLSEAKEEIARLTQLNKDLSETMSSIKTKNNKLDMDLEEIKSENRQLNRDLIEGNKTLELLKNTLREKSTDLDFMVAKTRDLKEHFSGLDVVMQDQLKELIVENENLKNKLEMLDSDRKQKQFSDLVSSNIKILQKPADSTNKSTKSPPSLLTICFNNIIKYIQPSEKSMSSTNSNISLDQSYIHISNNNDNHDEMTSELLAAHSEISRLSKMIEHYTNLNQQLIAERDEVRQEIQLLLEPAYELQKKINNHRTNLLSLTATTYAENKSLKSQVKVLQHHHSRCLNVCQKDIPMVKKKLSELLSILTSEYIDKSNSSFKRFSLPCILDSSSSINALKNESTLDGDLLMLDNNMTSTTSADNTLIGMDQTCLDITQVYPNTDVACQTNDNINVVPLNVVQEIKSLCNDDQQMYEKIILLEKQNNDLQLQIKELSVIRNSQIDVQTSPIKMYVCNECEQLSQELSNMKIHKEEIVKKYNNLMLEVPSTDALVIKLSVAEKEISNLTNALNTKNLQLKQFQQENDSLSTQIIENITETDDLNKQLDNFKEANAQLIEKCTNLEKILKENKIEGNLVALDCSQCPMKDEVIKTLQNVALHSKLSRSLSDSDTSSRYNKICTLQSELHAGREDCKELTEDVVTIKNHLERSNLSIGQNMDLDDSMGESNIFTFTKNFEPESQINKLNMSKYQPDRQLDVYTLEKNDCLNYYLEKTGADKENLSCNIKIIDLMKMFYNGLLTKHSNQIENLVNKIKCYEESRTELETHVNRISIEYSELKKILEEKENHIQNVTDTLLQIKQNISLINKEMSTIENTDNKNPNLVAIFKDKFLKLLDTELDLSSVSCFENLIDSVLTKQKQNELSDIMEQYTKLQEHVAIITGELNTVNDNLVQMKCQLSSRENDYNLLKAQKEKVHEISNAVTLDIIRKEQELSGTIVQGCKKLIENNIMCSGDINVNMPLNESIQLLFEHIITTCKPKLSENENHKLELKKSALELEENKKALETLTDECSKLKEINKNVNQNLRDVENKYQSQIAANMDLRKDYDIKVEENKAVLFKIDEITDELNKLKENLTEKENIISKIETDKKNSLDGLNEKDTTISELLKTVANYTEEIANLKLIHEVITKEKEACAIELGECKKTIEANKQVLDKMTFDTITLTESVKESSTTIEELKLDINNLLQQNVQLKEQLEEKCRCCSRLEMNIKTHEKSAEIQSKMIMRLQKQKEEDDKVICDKDSEIKQLTNKNSDLQKECEGIKTDVKNARDELEVFKNAKNSLEMRISELELDSGNVHKPRTSMEPVADSTRRRRQSIHDSRRMFTEDCGDHNKIEAVFDSRSKPQDVFMDVDDDNSNRSTPLRSSRGRDSLLSRHDQSEQEEDHSRPSSVAATRRRRQSLHDLHRTGVMQTPSPHERPSSRHGDSTNMKSLDFDNNNVESEITQLRENLSKCQQELEDLKKQYIELDEECETCSEYLREREAQCARLRKEKIALDNIVADLKEKLKSVNPNKSQQEPTRTFADAAANTDEDWTNLHSVVVDRMSFDAEVEKNKRLTKTVEELRFKKQDLKNTLAKMQKALEKNASKDYSRELEATKSELRACRQELKELKEKYKELGSKYDRCAQYLHEREEHCRKLNETKMALEAKLQECHDDMAGITHSLRKKRQSIHDQNRCSAVDVSDAATETSEDLLSYQVERDNDSHSKEVRRLTLTVDKLTQQKNALKQQLISVTSATAATPNPVYIATGSAIVQNQQITDVLKENQKLKKINAKLVQICKKRGKQSDLES